MREVLVIVLAAFSIGALPAQRDSGAVPRRDLLGKQFDARIVRVADGDTLEATAAGETGVLRIRLQGVDAPEQGEAFSREAQGFLRTLVVAQTVRISVRDIDRYGRLVARVIASGTDASVALVRAGLACHAYAADTILAREESRARAAGAGFWARDAKKPACVARTSLSAPSPGRLQYRGNVSNGLYHASTCPNFRCENCRREFASEVAAKAAGFRPASDCAAR